MIPEGISRGSNSMEAIWIVDYDIRIPDVIIRILDVTSEFGLESSGCGIWNVDL